jgi:hypothetical protein
MLSRSRSAAAYPFHDPLAMDFLYSRLHFSQTSTNDMRRIDSEIIDTVLLLKLLGLHLAVLVMVSLRFVRCVVMPRYICTHRAKYTQGKNPNDSAKYTVSGLTQAAGLLFFGTPAKA